MRKEIEYILAVAEEGSTARAAEKLYVGQPAVSKVIASLEESLGIKLFYRDRAGMIPTDAGWLYIDYANRVKDLEEDFRQRLKGTGKKPESVIRVAMTLNSATLLTEEINELIAKTYPGFRLRIDNVLSKDILGGLRSGKYQYAVCPNRYASDERDLHIQGLFSTGWLFITPLSLDLSSYCIRKGNDLLIGTEVIRQQEMILQEEGTSVRWEMDELLGLKDAERRMKREVANSLLAIEEVYDGAGCAVISESFRVFPDEKKVNVYNIDTDRQVVTSLVYFRGRKISEEEKAVIRLMCDYVIEKNDCQTANCIGNS